MEQENKLVSVTLDLDYDLLDEINVRYSGDYNFAEEVVAMASFASGTAFGKKMFADIH